MPPQIFLAWGTQDRRFLPRYFFLSEISGARELELPKFRQAYMGGGAAAHGRYFPDGTWSCIPEDAVDRVDRIAELKAAIEELNDILANSLPSCRDFDEVCARHHLISNGLMTCHFMSHSPLGR